MKCTTLAVGGAQTLLGVVETRDAFRKTRSDRLALATRLRELEAQSRVLRQKFDAQMTARPQPSSFLFDHAGWRNDTGRPSSTRTGPSAFGNPEATAYQNFSGDWAAATFSPDGQFILLGCPYDFDFRVWRLSS